MSTLRTERVRPARAGRATRRRRRRTLLLALGLPVLLAALAAGVWWLADGGGLGGGSDPGRVTGDQRVTVLAYRGEQTGIAVLATSASGAREDVILAIPTNVIASTPGHGTGPLGEALAGGSGVARTTVANLLGVPVDSAGVVTAADLEALGARTGGFDVDLGTRVTIEGRGAVGPGPMTLSGEHLAAYLDGTRDALESGLRFQEALPGIVAAAAEAPEALQSSVADADEGFAAEVAKVDPTSVIEELPVNDAGSGVASLDADSAAALVSELFATPTDHVASVVLLNGNGIPGIGAAMGERIVPAGFEVVVSTNARSFDFETTEIVVRSEGLLDEGRRLRSLLGLGRVSVGEASTGLADITVLIGRDFTGA